MTIKDIARISGFSVGTVSRVLNNHPDVSDDTRERVMAVVREHNFQPNANARHLKMQARSSVAILVKGTSNMLFAEILEMAQTRLMDNGEDAFVAYLDEDANEVEHAVKLIRERRPKGLLFLGGDLEYFRQSFKHISLPSVLLTNSAAELEFSNLSSLTTDDHAAAANVINYLLANGHERIGILGGNPSNTQISHSRIIGCRDSFDKNRLPFDQHKQCEPCRFSMEDGYKAAKRLLERNNDLTAIFAMSDVIALGAVRALVDLGRQVPADISIVGYDGVPISRYCVPRLTTIRQDAAFMARRGVEMLLHRIHNKRPAVHEIVPFQLIQGESVRTIN